MNKKRKLILGTGLTGMVGSRVVEVLGPAGFKFTKISQQTGADILDRSTLAVNFADFGGDWVVHLAAKASVDGCEEDKKRDMEKLGDKSVFNLGLDKIKETAGEFGGQSTAWAVNVVGTLNIASLCKEYGKKLIYVSTDFVFDGEKDSYCEEDKANPVNWYGVTKLMGEKVVGQLGVEYIVCRIAFPYQARYEGKVDLVRFILGKLRNSEELTLVEDQVVTPTFVDDIANGIRFLIDKESRGLFHLVGSSWVAPVELAEKIGSVFGLKMGKIEKIKREDFYKGRAARPFKLSLLNDRIKGIGFEPADIDSGLLAIKEQLKGEL